MIMADGTPKVIEFNCRMGDPETQPIMARLKSDLVKICRATLDGSLGEHAAEWDSRAALGVVMAAGGYPASYAKGKRIAGLADADGDAQKVFHAGTSRAGDDIVTSGRIFLPSSSRNISMVKKRASSSLPMARIFCRSRRRRTTRHAMKAMSGQIPAAWVRIRRHRWLRPTSRHA